MIRKHKLFSRPRKLYDKARIESENKLLEKYALKNKREIWKVEARVRYFRTRAKKLITASTEEQNNFFAKLNRIGLPVQSIADVLALTKEDLFKRRLTLVLVTKGLARTAREARQLVSHKQVKIAGRVMSSPGYLIHVDEESSLTVKKPVATKEMKAELEEVSA